MCYSLVRSDVGLLVRTASYEEVVKDLCLELLFVVSSKPPTLEQLQTRQIPPVCSNCSLLAYHTHLDAHPFSANALFPGKSYNLDVWSGSELFVIIICGSVPPLKVLWDRYIFHKPDASRPTTYNYVNQNTFRMMKLKNSSSNDDTEQLSNLAHTEDAIC